jgi:hypothetical protein
MFPTHRHSGSASVLEAAGVQRDLGRWESRSGVVECGEGPDYETLLTRKERHSVDVSVGLRLELGGERQDLWKHILAPIAELA